MLRVAVLTLALVAGVPLLSPSIDYTDGGLEVDVGDAQPGWDLLLVRAIEGEEGGLPCAGPSTLVKHQAIQAGQQKILFPAAGLEPGLYCAVVVSPAGNLTSLRPAEIKATLDTGPNLVKEPTRAKRSLAKRSLEEPCRNWSAMVIPKGDYYRRAIEVYVELDVHPRCEKLRVTLFRLRDEDASKGDCENVIMDVDNQTHPLRGHSLDVRFENVSSGNYCVHVKPVCEKTRDCRRVSSKVLELPPVSARMPVGAVPEVLQQSGRPSGGGAPEGQLLWLLLVPLLVTLALLMVGAVWLARRRARLAASSKKATLPVPPGTVPPRQQPVEVRVVYSRDSEAHVAAVGQLCALLQSELGVRVEYDEAATGPTHVTHDWALAMAHLPCPRFNEAPQGGRRVKMLVLESDGALLKHRAYRLHKDVGVASESSVDELYHTTYAALLSQQAQALGDYCHLLVARLPYTTLPDRLDLVPEKRFLLPDHLPHLLEALLHDPAKGPGGQQQQRIAAALRSEARARLDRALALAGSAHQGDGQGGLAHLRDVLLGSEEQV
ncbi:uncharacterized protein LOC144153581 isoform X1 [Haemaphysalis longicornis]